METSRCYSDQEWARAVAEEWISYDPFVDLQLLKFFRGRANINRPPKWLIGAAELWQMKRRELDH
jgi:hypothetical protein